MRAKLNDFSIMGSIVILLGLFFFAPKLFTQQNSLICIEEKLLDVETIYSRVKAKSHASIKAELSITLQNRDAEYTVFKNIGGNSFYSHFENIKSKLQQSKVVQIWIKENEESLLEPIIYQIGRNKNEILYSFKEAKELSKYGFGGSLILGLIFIGLSGTKYANDPNIRFGVVKISKLKHNGLNVIVILAFSYLTYLANRYDSLEMSLCFGGITILYLCLFLYYNIKKKGSS